MSVGLGNAGLIASFKSIDVFTQIGPIADVVTIGVVFIVTFLLIVVSQPVVLLVIRTEIVPAVPVQVTYNGLDIELVGVPPLTAQL